MINEISAMFPLCQACWEPLSPAERLPYYLDLHDDWQVNHGGSPYTQHEIRYAVLAGN